MKTVHGIYLPSHDTHFDTMITPDASGRGTYQLKKYLAARDYVKRRSLAVDIGGHVGLWSRVMSKDFQQVIAFEPLQIHRDCFRLNVLQDRENVKLLPYALTDKAGDISISMPKDNTGHSHVASKGEVVTETMKGVTLDSMTLGDRIDFLKIDVEGWELPVLQGGEKTIRRDRPTIIIEQKPHGNAERYGWGQRDALKLLLQWGFKEVAAISGDHILTG